MNPRMITSIKGSRYLVLINTEGLLTICFIPISPTVCLFVLSIMASNKEARRRQRRKELDARRSKFRVRLGSWPESWSNLKDQLGFSLHSELAQFLLDR